MGSLFITPRWQLPWVISVLESWGTSRDPEHLGSWTDAEEGMRRTLWPLFHNTSSVTALVLPLRREEVRTMIRYNNFEGDGLKLLTEGRLHAYLKAACSKLGGNLSCSTSKWHDFKSSSYSYRFLPQTQHWFGIARSSDLANLCVGMNKFPLTISYYNLV